MPTFKLFKWGDEVRKGDILLKSKHICEHRLWKVYEIQPKKRKGL